MTNCGKCHFLFSTRKNRSVRFTKAAYSEWNVLCLHCFVCDACGRTLWRIQIKIEWWSTSTKKGTSLIASIDDHLGRTSQFYCPWNIAKSTRTKRRQRPTNFVNLIVELFIGNHPTNSRICVCGRREAPSLLGSDVEGGRDGLLRLIHADPPADRVHPQLSSRRPPESPEYQNLARRNLLFGKSWLYHEFTTDDGDSHDVMTPPNW